jgi:hypothetical protein
MTVRFAMIVVLFAVASVVSGVLLAVSTWASSTVGIALGRWVVPGAVFAGFFPVFWVVRGHVLPPHLAEPPWKAAATLTAWIGLTLVMWDATMRLVRPAMRAAGFERGTFAILIACLLVGLLLIEQVGRRRRWV